MAYMRRNPKTGERHPVLTKWDRERRLERQNLRSWYPIPKITAVRGRPGDTPTKKFSRREVEHFWWWNNYDRATMLDAIATLRAHTEQGQYRNLLTLKRERGRIENKDAWSGEAEITIGGKTLPCEASPGYLALDRYDLVERRERLRNMELALRLWDHPEQRRAIPGESYDPPFARM